MRQFLPRNGTPPGLSIPPNWKDIRTQGADMNKLDAICPSHMFEKLKSAGTKLKREIKVYQLIRKDKRTPKMAKILLAAAIGYALLPFDIIPDFIPIIGHLDDVIIVLALVILALKMIPKEVIDDCRARANSA